MIAGTGSREIAPRLRRRRPLHRPHPRPHPHHRHAAHGPPGPVRLGPARLGPVRPGPQSRDTSRTLPLNDREISNIDYLWANVTVSLTLDN